MSGGIYGHDDVGALVFDPGHHSMRIGYAGEDLPKSEVPAVVGVSAAEESKPDEGNVTTKKKYHIDTVSLNYAKSGMDMTTYMKDGMINDWDLFEEVLDYSFAKVLRTESEARPVLFTEASWNQKPKREKLAELMIEKYNVPAFFICKSAVLAAFANGRSTCLVVDSGATHTSAVPVHDGYVLQGAIVKSPLGADFVTMQCRQLLEEQTRDYGGLVAPYEVASKEEVPTGSTAKFKRRPNIPEVTKSWHNYMIRNTVQDFQASVLQVSDMPYDEESLSNVPTVYHEMPNGYNDEYGVERYRIAETLFNPTYYKGPHFPSMLSVPHAITTSVGMCDMDLRPALYGSTIVTGGNTLLNGFVERLNRDLMMKAPANMRFKLITANGQMERRFGTWIGGSVLASLGNFHQMWISKSDFEETGKTAVERKCP